MYDPVAGDVWNQQLMPSPLAFRGDELVRVSPAGIEWWDTIAMKQVERSDVGYRAVCALASGNVVAFTGHELHWFDRNRMRTEMPGEVRAGGRIVHLLRAAARDEVYLGGDGAVLRYRIFDGALVKRFAGDPLVGQAAALGDGRLIEPHAETLRIIDDAGGVTVKYTPERETQHLAVADAQRVWTAFLTGRFTSQVTLEALDGGSTAQVWSIEGRVIHLAAGPRGAVVLVLHAQGWRMTVLDDTGGERWRAEVPRPVRLDTSNNHGFVALSEHRAVLSVDDRLLAWDAATGAPIAPGN